MTYGNPEIHREKVEKYFEHRLFSRSLESELLRKLESGQDVKADPTFCPVEACGNVLDVEVRDGGLELTCGRCGWKRVLKRAG